jgi:hypothetical protein
MFSALLFRSVVTAYIRIERYIEMAREQRFDDSRINSSAVSHARKVYLMRDVADVDGNMAITVTMQYALDEKRYVPAAFILYHIICSAALVACKTRLFSTNKIVGGYLISISIQFGSILIGFYSVLILMLGFMIYYLHNRTTGLKWDISSLADEMALIQGSNIFDIFSGMEYFHHGSSHREFMSQIFGRRPLRLGYWRKMGTEHSPIYWYGIAFAVRRDGI